MLGQIQEYQIYDNRFFLFTLKTMKFDKRQRLTYSENYWGDVEYFLTAKLLGLSLKFALLKKEFLEIRLFFDNQGVSAAYVELN